MSSPIGRFLISRVKRRGGKLEDIELVPFNGDVHVKQEEIRGSYDGAEVVSGVRVDSMGHVRSVGSRIMTATDIGAASIDEVMYFMTL